MGDKPTKMQEKDYHKSQVIGYAFGERIHEKASGVAWQRLIS